MLPSERLGTTHRGTRPVLLQVLPSVKPFDGIVEGHGWIPIEPSVNQRRLHPHPGVGNILDVGHGSEYGRWRRVAEEVRSVASNDEFKNRSWFLYSRTGTYHMTATATLHRSKFHQHPKPNTLVNLMSHRAERYPTSPCLMIMKITNHHEQSRHYHDT